jgi:hypothetical protein
MHLSGASGDAAVRVRRMMDEERHLGRTTADENVAHEPERRSIERAMHAYAAYLSSVERYQKSVADFRRVKDSHEAIQGLIQELAANRDGAAAGRLEVRNAVRRYVLKLRAEERPPEVTLGLVKRTFTTIVLAMPKQESLKIPVALLEDSVRWAIEAYYDAA